MKYMKNNSKSTVTQKPRHIGCGSSIGQGKKTISAEGFVYSLSHNGILNEDFLAAQLYAITFYFLYITQPTNLILYSNCIIVTSDKRARDSYYSCYFKMRYTTM